MCQEHNAHPLRKHHKYKWSMINLLLVCTPQQYVKKIISNSFIKIRSLIHKTEGMNLHESAQPVSGQVSEL